MTDALSTRFAPQEIEDALYAKWEAAGAFRPEAVPGGVPYTVSMPPPNVTGSLHMGHALNNTLQDMVIRFERMRGRAALWVPGTDHAGIATQAVVEKKLYQEKKIRRKDLGREKFLEAVWAWKQQYGDTIIKQLRAMGCSADWSRCRFTLDEGLSRAVREAFVRLWERDLIYRGKRLVNWDCVLQTAVSDDEIEYVETKGHLWHIRYPFEDGSGHVTVATTRPETMLGDTGVAVHPEDPRYAGVVGRRVILPLLDRPIPVIADPTVERNFGTGAVKVTPGHDPADYERGEKFNLPVIGVFATDGTINENGGPYSGMRLDKARAKIVEDLEAKGLLEKVEPYVHRVAVSDRSKSPIEPLVSEQWFVRMRPLAEPAIAAVKSGRLNIVPERWAKVYLDWLENVRDWCISRQLWWGHRIPVWYDADGVPVASRTDPAIGSPHPKTGNPIVRQDEDVLDTWASSWLWPFSTLGWPDNTADLAAFYPTQFLSTAREIIYLWVARMVMAGYAFLDHLPEEKRCPYSTVYIHATVLDAQGRRMSKQMGNGIDPVEMIGKYGADAVRFALCSLATENQDIKLAETKFEQARNFANKLWNASRFVFMNLEGFAAVPGGPDPATLTAEDRWILSRLHATIGKATGYLEAFRFSDYARVIYEFAWHDFCDWYLELAKPRLAAGGADRARTQGVLAAALDATLRMLHPAMPFLTESLWGFLQTQHSILSTQSSALSTQHSVAPSTQHVLLIVESWPKADPARMDAVLDEQFSLLQEIVRGVRDIRNKTRLKENVALALTVSTPRKDVHAVVRRSGDFLRRMANLTSVEAGENLPQPASSAAQVAGDLRLYVPLAGLLDIEAERKRLAAQIEKTRGLLAAKDRKLADAGFAVRAPADVVAAERERRDALATELAALDETLASLG
ncbi:MAG: valine--tRNA ligase [Planctomycetota bacterium]